MWLQKRIPAAKQTQLGHKTIFIFPSRFGGLYIFLCFGLFLLGTNYQNNLMLLLSYFLVALFLLNLFHAYFNFSGLNIQVGKLSSGYAGDALTVPIWLKSATQKHGELMLKFWPSSEQFTVDLDALQSPENIAIDMLERGAHTLPRLTVTSYYPLGLYRCWTHIAFDNTVIVYPKPIRCDIQLVSKASDNDGQEETVVTSGYDEFDTLTPYKPGEPLNHIAWKQLAKGQGLISKHFSMHEGASGWLVFNGATEQHIEQMLSELCYQVLALSRKNIVFGLDLPGLVIAPDTGAAHQHRCLSALAVYGQRDLQP